MASQDSLEDLVPGRSLSPAYSSSLKLFGMSTVLYRLHEQFAVQVMVLIFGGADSGLAVRLLHR
jgi:hypothetical protein